MSRLRTFAAALAVGACTAAVVYATSRAIQVWLFTDPDPRTMAAPTRIAFFWRAWVAFYAGTLATLGAYALRSRSPEAFDRWLPTLIVLTAAWTTLQGLVLP
ncbi:MAG: hypothetical protein HYV09_15520 [Deltaproteobacteria bacterium]|nr:hypothetical protein [Deltaproteobacteria bacterium]